MLTNSPMPGEFVPGDYLIADQPRRINTENSIRYQHVERILDTQLRQRLSGQAAGPIEGPAMWFIRSFIHHRSFLRMAYEWSQLNSGQELFDWLLAWLRPQVSTVGLANVPSSGRCLLVANHPTGFADGTALYSVVRHIRRDLGVFVIQHLMEFNEKFADRIIPIERRTVMKSANASRNTLRLTKQSFEKERLLTLFPAGRESRFTGRRIADLPWKTSFIKLAQRYDVPILPVHIRARHSLFFYLCRSLSINLAELQSLNEMQKNYRRSYHLTIGEPIPPSQLSGSADDLAQKLQYHVERVLPDAPSAVFSAQTDR